MTNLAQNLMDTAAKEGAGPALRMYEFHLSFEEFRDAALRVAAGLRSRGVEPGDRVGMVLPNVLSFPIVFYGALLSGAAVVPMNPLLKAREIEYYLRDSGARVVVAGEQSAEPAAEAARAVGVDAVTVGPAAPEELMAPERLMTPADRADDDTAVILYTSGTTGKPKGAELTHSNLLKNAEVSITLADTSPGDILLGALPLFHSFGQTCGLNAAMLAGATLSMIPRFDPDKALAIIERDKVTIFQGVPTMFTGMLHSDSKDDADVSCLRVSMSGGSAMPVEVMRGFEEQFGCKVLEGYGLSETSPVASFNHADSERKPGTIGTPIDGVEMKVVDEDGKEVDQGEVGEIVIKGHNVMKGYWNRPDATEEAIKDGWFHTGDMGKIDEDGYFSIVDRKKELIIRGGYNVYPREIEEVLYEHPAVQEAAVVAVEDEKMGEEVGAAVVLKKSEDVDADELKAFCKERLAGYKYPRRIWFVDELPKGPTGKILKREIEVPEEVAAGT